MTGVEPTGTEATIERSEGGWSIRLPLRREDLRLEKRTVVAERLLIRRQQVPDVARVDATLRREQLHIDRDGHVPAGDLDATQPLDRP